MIERNGNQRTLLCDGCDDLFDQVNDNHFPSMIASARDDGWKIVQGSDGCWSHTCSKCQLPAVASPKISRLEQQRRLLTR